MEGSGQSVAAHHDDRLFDGTAGLAQQDFVDSAAGHVDQLDNAGNVLGRRNACSVAIDDHRASGRALMQR